MTFTSTAAAADPLRPLGDDRLVIFVLGMHRSGTSAFTRVLNLLGAELPARLMDAHPEDNPRGFWESPEIADFNESVLWKLDRTWDDVRETPPFEDWSRNPGTTELLDRGGELLARDFSESSLVVIKDPRVCRLVGFWGEVASRSGFEPAYLLPIRHPAEVAASLKGRDGVGPVRAERLWTRYTIEAERSTRGAARAFASFDQLLRDPWSCMESVGRDLGLAWPADAEVARKEIDRFLARDLRHHRRGDEPSTLPTATRLYQTLLSATDDADRSRAIDGLVSQLAEEIEAELPLIEEYQQSLLRTRRELGRRLAEIEAQRADTESTARWARELAHNLEAEKASNRDALAWILAILLDGEPFPEGGPSQAAFEERAARLKSLKRENAKLKEELTRS